MTNILKENLFPSPKSRIGCTRDAHGGGCATQAFFFARVLVKFMTTCEKQGNRFNIIYDWDERDTKPS